MHSRYTEHHADLVQAEQLKFSRFVKASTEFTEFRSTHLVPQSEKLHHPGSSGGYRGQAALFYLN